MNNSHAEQPEGAQELAQTLECKIGKMDDDNRINPIPGFDGITVLFHGISYGHSLQMLSDEENGTTSRVKHIEILDEKSCTVQTKSGSRYKIWDIEIDAKKWKSTQDVQTTQEIQKEATGFRALLRSFFKKL